MSVSSDSQTSAESAAVVLVDTSVAVAIVLADHEAHRETLGAVAGTRLGLSGHAAFETYSVLTRLGPGARRSPATVQAIIERDFPETRYLSTEQTGVILRELADAGITGGSVYDALVGAAARAAGLPLLSRARRARPTYERLGVDIRYLG